MKKEELLSLGLTEEQADKVIVMNGLSIENLRKAAENAKADKKALEEQVKDRDKDIEDLKAKVKADVDADAIRKQLEELRGKYDKETEAYKAQLAQRDYQSAVDKAIADSGVKFTSKSAEKAFRAEIKLEMKDGALAGFDKYLEQAKSNDPSAFVKAGSRIDTQGSLEGGTGGDKTPTTLAGALHAKYDK